MNIIVTMSNFKSFAIYSLSCFSLLLGLAFDENSSGGAKLDFEYLFPYIDGFSLSLKSELLSYINNPSTIIHSPVFYILVSLVFKFIDNITIIKILYIFLCSFFPFIFFLILRDKFKVERNILFIFSLVIFLSPYFRSSAIWLLGDNLSLIFFGLSIYYFNKVNSLNGKNIKDSFLCMFFLILCCYIRYYYCLFSFYYLFFLFRELHKKNFFLLILISFILSFPAFFYSYFIILNFDFTDTLMNYSQFNFYSNTLVILSILLFYLIPFCFLRKNSFLNYLRINKKLLFLIFLLVSVLYVIGKFFFIDLVNFSSKGGGVFMKIANFNNIDPLFFLSITSFLSLIILDYFFKNQRLQNYILLIILVMSFPIFTIYQKYFDPLFFLFFFGLVKSDEFEKIFKKGKNFLLVAMIYFLSFYFFSLIYYSNGFQ